MTDHPRAPRSCPPALALPLTAGAVNGTAVALAQAGDERFHPVDDPAPDRPPPWVHEGEAKACRVATGGT